MVLSTSYALLCALLMTRKKKILMGFQGSPGYVFVKRNLFFRMTPSRAKKNAYRELNSKVSKIVRLLPVSLRASI